MSTILQKELANNIIENQARPQKERLNKKDLLVSTGYSKITAKATPSEIIDSKGVKDALKDAGLTEKLISEALVEDIKSKKKRGKRIQELNLGAEILGMKQKQKTELPQTLQNIAVFIKQQEQPLHLEATMIDT